MSDYNEISKRAYELWESAGKPEGKDGDFWYQAEKEVQRQGNGNQKQSGRSLQSPRGAKPIAGPPQ